MRQLVALALALSLVGPVTLFLTRPAARRGPCLGHRWARSTRPAQVDLGGITFGGGLLLRS
jgi:hypothetical protein